MQSTLIDITERKRAAEEVRRLAKFPSENPNPVLRVTKDGTILYANPAGLPLLNMWGCQVGQIIPEYWHKFVLDVLGSGSSKNIEIECGERVLFLTFAPVIDMDYVNLYGLDITEHKRIEEKLQASQSELFAIYDNVPVIMLLVDQERRVQKVNYTAARFAQRAAEEMIGLYGGEALRCIHSTDDPRGCGFGRFCEACPVRRIVLDTFETGKNHYKVEAKLQFASRQGDVTVLASTILLNPPEGQRVLVCIEDITERRRKAGKQKTASPVTLRGPLMPLQARFAKAGLEGFTDQETFELFMSLCPYRMEMLPKLNERCLKTFKNIRELLSASPQQLHEAGLAPECMFYIKLLREIPAEVLKQKIVDKPVYKSPREILDYLSYSMRDLKKEIFKVIYLNKRDQIIDVVDLFEGTFDVIPISPRVIIDSAIKHNASALIFVHNHPTGDPTPGRTDKRLTRDFIFVGNVLQIRVLDHIVIGEDRYFSFAEEGLIQKYEDDFLNIKIRRI